MKELEGRSYLYSNPLACRGGILRRAWYHVPCCPWNLSRLWAWLGKYLYSYDGADLWVHQYVSSETEVELGVPVRMAVESSLSWQGGVHIQVTPRSPARFTLHLRIASWTERYRLLINGQAIEVDPDPGDRGAAERPASDYSPHQAAYVSISRRWSPGDVVEAVFPMPLTVRRPHPRVRSVRGRVALTRGPPLYCLESVDQPDFDLFASRIDLASLRAEFSLALLGGVWILRGQTVERQEFSAIPYFTWANRGESQMVVWVRA
jgi:DUF1680 family protein